MQFLELTMRGVLSFGPDTPPFSLRPLNVLIGPNGSAIPHGSRNRTLARAG